MGAMADTVQRVFQALDVNDADTATALIAEDAQGIDEISRRWMRGRDEMTGYVREMLTQAMDIHSEVRDIHEAEWGEAGVVTFWLEQGYTLNGERQQVSAPTTAVLRRQSRDWKIALFHSIPISPAS